jgi:hypothetical protein
MSMDVIPNELNALHTKTNEWCLLYLDAHDLTVENRPPHECYRGGDENETRADLSHFHSFEAF